MKIVLALVTVVFTNLAMAQTTNSNTAKVATKADFLDYFKKNFTPECELFDTEKVYVLKIQKDCLAFQSSIAKALELGPKCLETKFKVDVKAEFKKICDSRLADAKAGKPAVNTIAATAPEIAELFVAANPAQTANGTTVVGGTPVMAAQQSGNTGGSATAGSNQQNGSGSGNSGTTANPSSTTAASRSGAGANAQGTPVPNSGNQGSSIGGLPAAGSNTVRQVAGQSPAAQPIPTSKAVIGPCGADCDKPQPVTYSFCRVTVGIGTGGGHQCYFNGAAYQQPEDPCDKANVGKSFAFLGQIYSCMPSNASQPELALQFEKNKTTDVKTVAQKVLAPTKSYMWFPIKPLFEPGVPCVSSAVPDVCDGKTIGQEKNNECYVNRCARVDENKDRNLMHWSNLKSYMAASTKEEDAAYQAKQDAALAAQRAALERKPAGGN